MKKTIRITLRIIITVLLVAPVALLALELELVHLIKSIETRT